MIEIKTRTGEVIYTSATATTVREATEEAANVGASLADANLAGACLADANLERANLERANLERANLERANLEGANLEGANLEGANLADANLAGAYLAGANLAGACLAYAYLADANLADACLAYANLADAYLADARHVPQGVTATDPPEPYRRPSTPADYAIIAERYRQRHPEVPVVPNLDRQILDRIERGGGSLDMADWHTCETTHCRAGWAIALAGEDGRRLEAERGPFYAGSAIYRASTGRVPHFFASNSAALEDLRARAAEQTGDA